MKSSALYKPAIVIPACNRVEPLERLLNSVDEATYPNNDTTLIISIDGGAKQDVIAAAKNFRFRSVKAKVHFHTDNLGVRNHVLWCADLTKEYGSVIILEDDLVVGPAFYQFAAKSLEFYNNEPSIAGISLYSPRYNETARLPFEPVDSEWPVYFMKLGCSWGQAWTSKQWDKFRHWYNNNQETDFSGCQNLPENVKKWPGSSWKKYFNLYLVQKQKYMVYPFRSYSTNPAGDNGEHIKDAGSLFQVPLHQAEQISMDEKMPHFHEVPIRYDAFMEAEGKWIETWSGIPEMELEMDMYGSKPLKLLQQKKYSITSKKGGEAIRKFPLTFRPIELNVKFEMTGNEKPFFGLFSKDSLTGEKISAEDYFRMAEYFSYFNFKTKSLSFNIFFDMIKNVLKGRD